MAQILDANPSERDAAVREAVKPGRIIVVRHGRPNLSRNCLLTANEYEAWWRAYDESGLANGERPPDRLVALAREAHHIYSSTLPRAHETAKTLANGRDVKIDELFVEVPLPRPPLPLVRCNPTNWGWIARTFWTLGYSPGLEGVVDAARRANEAADRLIEVASAGGTVLLCAHGFMNWMVSVALRGKGWRRIYNGGFAYWSWREFERRRR